MGSFSRRILNEVCCCFIRLERVHAKRKGRGAVDKLQSWAVLIALRVDVASFIYELCVKTCVKLDDNIF